eukprot:scaffold77963_cov67-Phaeocystis_antarctica.AAC.2
MQGCTVTRRAVDLGCLLNLHDPGAPRYCEFDAERRPEIRAARFHQLAVHERPKYLCPLCKCRSSCIRLSHLDGHLQLEPPLA